MIYSGIEIGLFFETSLGSSLESCKNLTATFRPFLQITFVFVQMYFIFLNQKVSYSSFMLTSNYFFYFQMNVYKNKFISRLGLMHMIATNLCVWLNVLIIETSHEIFAFAGKSFNAGEKGNYNKAIQHQGMLDCASCELLF